MDINTSVLGEAKIGEVFTPLSWAKWLVLNNGVFDKWLDGAHVCDPTAGRGVFALALFDIARERGNPVTAEMLLRLSLIELRQRNLDAFLQTAKSHYDIKFPLGSLYCADLITQTPSLRCDLLVGNPPWSNFTDLPVQYKDHLKPFFIKAGLVPDRKAVLLGSSRTDIAALILKAALGSLLNDGGEGHFFVPLSLFTGDDAHVGFRDYRCFSSTFAVSSVFEFNESVVFEGVGTSYCCASFCRGQQQTFPIPYFREDNKQWVEHKAIPLKASSDPWRVIANGAEHVHYEAIDVKLRAEQKPRQGVNTCGANDVFIFEERPNCIDERYLFPLATKEVWKNSTPTPHKWIFLPYNIETGRVLNATEIQEIKGYDFLLSHLPRLSQRKGTLISNAIQKGFWWSLLGVGPYSFAPYKVIWQAFGKRDFCPIVLSDLSGQPWQANQAMQAFIPCWTKADAERVRNALQNPHIEMLLSEMNGEGKCNWAQPGKMKKVLSYDLETREQLTLLEEEREYRTMQSTQRLPASRSMLGRFAPGMDRATGSRG